MNSFKPFHAETIRLERRTGNQKADTPSLPDLLRRMAGLSPNALDRIISRAMSSAPRDIRECVDEYGAIPALVRLVPLFPEGYLESSPTGSSSKRPTKPERARVQLVQRLHRELPQLPRSHQTAVSCARLDDIVFSEVVHGVAKRGSRAKTELLENLFKIYNATPRLSRLDTLVGALKDEIDLSNAVVVAHQHILGSVASQFAALWGLGLVPSRTYIVGKPYSTNRIVAAYLEERGCNVRSGFAPFDREATEAPDWYQAEHHDALGDFFAKVVKSLPRENIDQLIVLDDGGLILTWLNRAFDSGLFTAGEMRDLSQLHVIGVEQTTFGRHLVESLVLMKRSRPKHNARVPVANVAQTRLKLEKETELIARSVVHELGDWIRSSDARGRHVDNLHRAKIGVIGYGVVGSWVCRALHHDLGLQVIVFDDDISHSSIARSSGYRVVQSAAELARECSVIIGCTGSRDGVELEADMLVPGTILASASSGNFEFVRVFMSADKKAGRRINPELTRDRHASRFDWLHSIVTVPVAGGDAYVLNSGFPINFTGGVDPIRADDIELTRCLMVLGVASALRVLPRRPNFGGTVTLATIDEALVSDMFGI